MQTNTSLIKDYIPLDFNSLSQDTLKKHPLCFDLKQWRKDSHFLFFLESIKQEYSVLLYELPIDDSPKILILPKSLLIFMEKVLEANKDLKFEFSFCNFEGEENIFYGLDYDSTNKDIFLYKKKIYFKRIENHFKLESEFWQKNQNFIIKEDDSIILGNFNLNTYRNSKIFIKTNRCDYLFSDKLLKTYFLARISTPIIKDLHLLPYFVLSSLRLEFNLLKNARVIQEVVENTLKTKIPFNLNKLNLFMALSFGVSLPFIEEKERNKIYQFLLSYKMNDCKNEFFKSCKQVFYKRKKFNCFNLCYLYLLEKINPSKEENRQLLKDYVELVYQTKSTFNLKIQSIKRIKQEHDVLVKELEKSKIPKNKKLKISAEFIHLNLPQNFTLLKTEKELYLQGQKQHNCVWTRKNRINQGLSAIYNLNYKKKDYTLEIEKKRKQFAIFELKGRYNQHPTREVLSYVRNQLKELNT
ncbi:PcfJ domain-containing protein [Helicobacter sp. MIT 21-1697]|uniref:PcfJ domain-containing protein n=1 Tax=Helicobacter sp. MIT 21-1697 TaxID=2993733 RepID=UPI00224A8B72|nr:PcfJ domain-containing protein [Helicobacter sp. MIT 21-1697]MCX2716824.1 PcfJ domain-containing protein [Helicobacter sp. MIT 21-1697]